MSEHQQNTGHTDTAAATPAHSTPVPVLTLSPEAADKFRVEEVVNSFETAQQQAPGAPDAQAAIAAQLDSTLSQEEKTVVEEFSKQIDIADPQHAMLYGADAQKKVSDFADSIWEIQNKMRRHRRHANKADRRLETFESSTEKLRVCALFTSAESTLPGSLAVRSCLEKC